MVILGTAKCDQTSMGTDVMCKSSQLVYNYLLICLTLSYVLSGGMAFHRRKHGIEFVCPEKRAFPGENAGLSSFVRQEGCSAGQTKKVERGAKKDSFSYICHDYQTMVYGISV